MVVEVWGAESLKKRSIGAGFVGKLTLLGALSVTACGDARKFSENSTGGTSGAASQGGASGAATVFGGAGGTRAQGGGFPGAGGTPQGGVAQAGEGGEDPDGGSSGAQTSGGWGGLGSGGVGVAGAGAGGAAGTSSAGAGNSGGAGGAAGITIQQFCDLLQPRARSWLRECRLGFGDASAWWGTQNIDSFCTSGRAAVEAGRLAYDPVRAEACAAQSVGDCDTIAAFVFATRVRSETDPCNGVVSPKVPLGGACHADSTRYSSECTTGFCGGKTCPGTCTSYPKVGESCDSTAPCDPSLAVCSGAGKCQAYAKLGESCASGQSCASGLVCASDIQAPVCVEKREVGQTCQSQYQCVPGSVCYQNKCFDKLPPNAACNSDANCPVGTYCAGTCTPRIPVDGACNDGLCIEGAYCSDGRKCRLYGQAGEPCYCAGDLWCDETNTCRAKVKLGDDCGQSTTANLAVRCEAPFVCLPLTLGQNGPANFECLTPTTEGEPCAATFGCKAPYFCEPTTSRCQTPAAKGQACEASLPLQSCQQGLFCQCTGVNCAAGQAGPGTCQTRAANGADCSIAAGCTSGVCDNTTKKCTPSSLCL